jgi:uncharacterized protein YbbK (DUF523 family)
MIRVLVSSCLLGQPVRYNGSAKQLEHPILARWRRENRLVPFCPEVEAGFPVPRPAAEIVNGDGFTVLDGRAKVVDQNKQNVTQQFLHGGKKAMKIIQELDVKLTILTDGSPSCGSTFIYNGTFSGTKITGAGITTALLEKNGVKVFNQAQIEVADEYLNTLVKLKEQEEQ